MNSKSFFRMMLAVVLLVGLSLSCNFISNVQETFEMKNTAEAFITEFDVEGIATEFEAFATEFDIEAMTTDIDIEAITTDIDLEVFATDFDIGAMVTEFDTGELLGTDMPSFTGEKPADIPVMEEGSELVASSDLVEYFTDASVSEVVAFYEQEMPVNGWVKSEQDVGDDYANIVYTKGTRKATLDVFSFFQTSVTIYIEGN
jgi:hypothetical protein